MHLTWSNNWIQAYESSWCTINKFSYANVLTGTDLFNLLNLSTRYADYTTSCYHTLIEQLEHIGVHSCEHHMHYLSKLLGGLYDNDNLNKYFSPFLTYCPICLSQGYHAWFHQSIFIDTCPIHKQPLQYLCPCCNQPLSIDLNITKGIPAFTCLCGYSLINKIGCHSMISKWISPIDIGESTIGIPAFLKSSLKTYYYQYNTKHTPQPLKVVNLASLMIEPRITSSIITLKTCDEGSIMSKINIGPDALLHISQQQQLLQLVECYIVALKVIAKMIRRSCKNITSSIQLLKNNKGKHFYCSYYTTPLSSIRATTHMISAYAYIMWRKDVEGHETFETVHTNLKIDSHSNTFTGLHEHILRSKVFQYFWAQLEEFNVTSSTVEHYVRFNSILKYLMYDMLLSHYNNWIRYARKKFIVGKYIEIIDLYAHIPCDFPFYFSHSNNEHALIVSKVHISHDEKEETVPYVSNYAR